LKPLYKTKTLELYACDTSTPLNTPYFESGVSAGFPSPAEDHMQSKIDLNDLLIEHPSATYYVLVNGDLLIVDRSIEVNNNCIVVTHIDGEFTVKRIKKNKNKIFLQAENTNYKPIKITEDMDFEVFGVVTHAIHHFV